MLHGFMTVAAVELLHDIPIPKDTGVGVLWAPLT